MKVRLRHVNLKELLNLRRHVHRPILKEIKLPNKKPPEVPAVSETTIELSDEALMELGQASLNGFDSERMARAEEARREEVLAKRLRLAREAGMRLERARLESTKVSLASSPRTIYQQYGMTQS